MFITSERFYVANAARRWATQYADGRHGADKLDILRRLRALDASTATADDVDGIIGNNSWTTDMCDECRTRSRVVAAFGKCDNSVRLCPACVRSAFAALLVSTKV
jgi:hypothetical protein